MTSTLPTDNPDADARSGVHGGTDHVDGGPDQDELAARLRLAVTRLHRRLRQQAEGGLTPSQASALAGVGRLGSPTLGALAASESVQPPSMTRIVGTLEELGYVTRVVDPSDRRVVRITITPSGETMLRHNRSLKNAFLADRLLRLDVDDRAALAALTALLERLVERDEP
ncbi:MAG: MarR family transcriptional regulator [Acidimicrobiales bacterium]|jgi:DNA-binding MarR family transcriptional regulator